MAQHATATDAQQTPDEVESWHGLGKLGLAAWITFTLYMFLTNAGDFSLLGLPIYALFCLGVSYYIVLAGRSLFKKLHLI